MEGDGGVVAVVQRLQDAGLAVTLLARRSAATRERTSGTKAPSQASQTVVDSGTETAFGQNPPRNAGLRTSYQVAHCRPSASPVRLPQYSTQGFLQFRSSTSRSHDEEVFVESLRKYPYISPIRSRSADLIQRMISYAQNKNSSKYANSRSAKSLPSKEGTVQISSDEIPTRDTGITTATKPNFGFKRDVELVPVPTSNRKSRCDNQIGMYDYLSGRKDKKLKASEVRYLTTMKQCLKERLKQMCDDSSPSVCSKMQSRYIQHRKQYHRSDTSSKCADCRNKSQASSPSGIQSASTSKDRSKENRSFKNHKACFCNRSSLCDCPTSSKSFPKSRIPTDDLISDVNTCQQCPNLKPTCPYECNRIENIDEQKLEETVLDWVQELPVYANFSTRDRLRREEMINQLIDTLRRLQKDENFLENAEQEIKKCLNILPMWHPEDIQDKERFDNQLANSLIQRLKNLNSDASKIENEISKWLDSVRFIRDVDKKKIAQELTDKIKTIAATRPSTDQEYKEALKSAIVNTLNELPLEVCGYRVTCINELADKLAESLISIPLDHSSKKLDVKSLVLDWVKNIPEFSGNGQLNSEDYALVNDLIIKLNNLQSQGGDNEKQMHNEITNWLNTVEEKKNCRIDRKTKQLLTSQLLEKFKPPTVRDVVKKWFDLLPDVFGVDVLDYKTDFDTLCTKLEELESIEDDEQRQNIMRKEVLDWLKKLQKKRGKCIDSGTEENLVNKLMCMMRNKSKTANGGGDENDLITQKIWDWLKSQPEFQQDIASNYRNMVTQLSENLHDIIVQKGELTRDDVKAALSNWFEKLIKRHGLNIDTKSRKMLEEQILSTVTLSKRKNWQKPKSILKTVKKEVDKIFDDPTIKLPESDRARLKEQITKVLTRDWNAIHSTQTDKPLSEIISILKNETNLPEDKIKSLAQSLIDKVKDATLSNLVDTVQSPLILDRPLKEKLRSKVDNILKTLPIKNKRELVDAITDTLEKSYKDGDDNASEAIYDALKSVNLTESEAAELTDKILDMSNSFRHEVTESGHDTTYSSYESMESLWVQKQMFMQRLEREITDFMEKVLNESSSLFRENPPDLMTSSVPGDDTTQYNQFKMPPLKTSTPRSGSIENDLKNGKETKSAKLTAVHIDVEMDRKPGTSESEYKDQIEGKIRMWISGLELDSKINSKYKDNMAKDIANDIIDRQRYIQLSKSKTTSQEELEHLKYQVFKWTSKLPDQNNLTTSTSKIKVLMKSLEVAKVPNLIGQTNKQDAGTENQIYFTSQDTSEFIEEKIFSAILNWISNMPLLKLKKSQEDQINDLINELSIKLKHILSSDPSKDETNIEAACKEEILIFIRKLNLEQKLTEVLIQKTANDLMNYLKNLQLYVNVLERLQEVSRETNDLKKKEAIKKAVQNWCRKLPLKRGTTYDDVKETVDKLADAISRYLLITDINNLNMFMDEILSNLKQLPLQFDKEDYKRLPEFTEKLIETLKNVLNDEQKYSTVSKDSSIPKQKKAVEVMYDNIQSWCENLPIDLGTSGDNEKTNAIKQNIASKLIKKIGELNLDPEVFHDDFLYEDILNDEIDQILDSLPKSSKLVEILPALKEDLIKKIIRAKEEMRDEIAGYAYKQKLRDAISKTLSSVGLPVTEDTSFDVLKENLADAFISLHYVTDGAELKKQFKDKIYNEVNKFCNEYLKRHPSSPLNATQLNKDLYDALKKVPMPKDESMRREVEQIRMKDVVADWFKDLSLEDIPSHVQENKVISVLTKRLLEIEKEADFDPSIDTDEMMQNEISKWLKKFNLKFKGKTDTESVTKKLINKLKDTKDSRKLDETATRKSINYADLTSDLEEGTSFQPDMHGNMTRGNPTIQQNTVTNTVRQFAAYYPPSGLSADDRAHLQRIKDRAPLERTILKPDEKKDAAVSPPPIPAAIQTEIQPNINISQKVSQNASIQTLTRETEPYPITPQVIIKEYYWDSSRSPPLQSGSILSVSRPCATPATNIRQQAKTLQENSHVVTASQTLPLPTTSKGTITQKSSIRQVAETQAQTSTQTSTNPQLIRQKVSSNTQQEAHFKPEDNIHLNMKKRTCGSRLELPSNIDTPEVGTSRVFQEIRQDIRQQDGGPNCRTDCRSGTYLTEDSRWETPERICHQPCFRRRIYQAPTTTIELDHAPKRKRRNQQCNCKNHTVPKCTIRPSEMSCEYSHKTLKYCTKCWDGYCPHPSYLYFKRD